MISLFVSI
jgi:hypothetical protein